MIIFILKMFAIWNGKPRVLQLEPDTTLSIYRVSACGQAPLFSGCPDLLLFNSQQLAHTWDTWPPLLCTRSKCDSFCRHEHFMYFHKTKYHLTSRQRNQTLALAVVYFPYLTSDWARMRAPHPFTTTQNLIGPNIVFFFFFYTINA